MKNILNYIFGFGTAWGRSPALSAGIIQKRFFKKPKKNKFKAILTLSKAIIVLGQLEAAHQRFGVGTITLIFLEKIIRKCNSKNYHKTLSQN